MLYASTAACGACSRVWGGLQYTMPQSVKRGCDDAAGVFLPNDRLRRGVHLPRKRCASSCPTDQHVPSGARVGTWGDVPDRGGGLSAACWWGSHQWSDRRKGASGTGSLHT